RMVTSHSLFCLQTIGVSAQAERLLSRPSGSSLKSANGPGVEIARIRPPVDPTGSHAGSQADLTGSQEKRSAIGWYGGAMPLRPAGGETKSTDESAEI